MQPSIRSTMIRIVIQAKVVSGLMWECERTPASVGLVNYGESIGRKTRRAVCEHVRHAHGEASGGGQWRVDEEGHHVRSILVPETVQFVHLFVRTAAERRQYRAVVQRTERIVVLYFHRMDQAE